MTIEIRLSQDKSTVTIAIRGRFDFSLVKDFRDAYESNAKAKQYDVDLQQTDHLDSSALGMLLNMRKFLGGDSARISIRNASPGIRKILEISRFDKKFNIL